MWLSIIKLVFSENRILALSQRLLGSEDSGSGTKLRHRRGKHVDFRNDCTTSRPSSLCEYLYIPSSDVCISGRQTKFGMGIIGASVPCGYSRACRPHVWSIESSLRSLPTRASSLIMMKSLLRSYFASGTGSLTESNRQYIYIRFACISLGSWAPRVHIKALTKPTSIRNGSIAPALDFGGIHCMVHCNRRCQLFAGCVDFGQLQCSTPRPFLYNRNRHRSSWHTSSSLSPVEMSMYQILTTMSIREILKSLRTRSYM